MENLTSHISYLIARRDCVIIPGVGAFVATNRPARYNAATGRWLPPTRHLTFNAAIRTDDGLMAHSFARRMKVEFEDAAKELALAVDDLTARLAGEGRYDLGRLGMLVAEEDRIIYRPAMTSGQRAARLGLVPVAARMVSEATAALSGEDTATDAVISADEALNAPHDISGAPRSRRWMKSLGKVAAAFVVAILAGLSFMAPGMTDSETQMASVVPVSALQAPSHSSAQRDAERRDTVAPADSVTSDKVLTDSKSAR